MIATALARDNTPQQILMPSDHVRILHPVRPGVATVAESTRMGWIEKAVPLKDLGRYVELMNGQTNAFVSQQSFYGWRRVAQLARLGACYVDLDFYRTEFRHDRPEAVAHQVLRTLDDECLPSPSYVLSSGRGLLVVWLTEETNRAALPRWMAVQKHLADALRSFGADRKALDAARVFRLAGSVNDKVSEIVRPVWMSGPLDRVQRWTFEDLAREVLPLTRGQLVSLRVERAKRRAEGAAITPQTRLDAGTLWETYLADLQRLRRLRWFGGLPSGQRDTWMFLAATAMSWLTLPGQPLMREVYALAQEAGGWSERETASRMSSVYHRAAAAGRGERLTWRGSEVDPRYRFKASTIVDWLEISPTEMREAGLRALVTQDVRREIEAADKRAARKPAQEARRMDRDRMIWEAKKMAVSGSTQAEIAADFGVSQRTVGNWLKS